MWPVIQRELRAEARRPLNRRLRLGSAALALAAVLLFVLTNQGIRLNQSGLPIFLTLHALACLVIWVMVPLMTADCISRERREGTLGLLFLTPLTASGIAIGKSLAEGLRAMTVWWAVLPAMAIPFVMGGITAFDLFSAFLIQLCSLVLALAVGVLASSYSRRWASALVAAAAGAAIAAFAMAMMVGFAHGAVCDRHFQGLFKWRPHGSPLFGVELMLGRWVQFNADLNVTSPVPGWGVGQLAWAVSLMLVALMTLVFVTLGLWLAAVRLRQAWQDRPPSRRQLALQRFWCTPRFATAWLRRKQDHRLDRNPIGWLHAYSAGQRLLKWGLCLGVVVFETGLLGLVGFQDFEQMQWWVGLAVVFGIAFSAAGSFQQERETGALELILVTPIRERQIISGRLLGIWSQFLPTLIPLMLAWSFSWESEVRMFAWGMLVDFAVLPVVGFYLSLRCRSFFTAWIGTAVVAVVVPQLPFVLGWGMQLLRMMLGAGYFPGGLVFSGVPSATVLLSAGFAVEILCGLLAWWLLWRNLANRRFAFNRV
jgi:ABC-type transport system involved in multi-copper enzyme maturation permease subunit